MKWVRDPLLWLTGLFIALLYLMPHSAALFNALIPGLPRPVYQQESFVNLTGALLAGGSVKRDCHRPGTGAGIAVTRPAGSEFRPLVETIAATGQTFRRWPCWRLPCRRSVLGRSLPSLR